MSPSSFWGIGDKQLSTTHVVVMSHKYPHFPPCLFHRRERGTGEEWVDFPLYCFVLGRESRESREFCPSSLLALYSGQPTISYPHFPLRSLVPWRERSTGDESVDFPLRRSLIRQQVHTEGFFSPAFPPRRSSAQHCGLCDTADSASEFRNTPA